MNYNATATRLTLYALISAIETDLRIFILNNTIVNTKDNIFDEGLVEKLKERSESSMEFDFEISNLIQYLDFGDCISLINKLINILPESLKKQLKTLTESLLRLTPIRNRVMHSRPLEFSDFPAIIDFINKCKLIKVVNWTNTTDIQNKINSDPSIIFSLKIPEIKDNLNNVILNNLPPVEFDDTGFIGRSDDIDIIRKKIYGNYPVVSIIGDGGIGKTALTLKCMYDILDDPNQPFDAIIWVSLKTSTLSNGEFKNIKNAMSTTFEMYTEIQNILYGNSRDDKEIISSIIEYMKEFKILLVLDNFETINSESVRDFLENIPIGSKVVITSRIGVGEFETRNILSGFNRKERISYITRLAQNNKLFDILKLGSDQVNLICERLYSSPLAIKWFIANVLKGEPVESILHHTDDLTNYCMSNVYDKLSKQAKEILEIMLVFQKECSDAEIGYLVGGEPTSRRKAINELLSTNMVRMRTISEDSIKKSVFSISEFAREYLQQHCKPSSDSFKNINKKIQNLRGLGQNLSLEKDMNPYDPKSLTYTQHTDELIAAYNLKQALFCSIHQDRQNEIKNFINKAKEVAPNYFEVYKISAFIAASTGDIFSADNDYKTAIQCKENYAPLLYLYAGFKMRYLDDFLGALELTMKAEELDPENIEIKIQKARLNTLLNDYDTAQKLFTNLLNEINVFQNKIKRITVNYAADNARRWTEKLLDQENIGDAIILFELSLSFIKILDDSEKDSFIIITLCKILSNMTCVYPVGRSSYKDIITKLIIETLGAYIDKMMYCEQYIDMKVRIKKSYPHISPENQNVLTSYFKEDIFEKVSAIDNDIEGFICEIFSTYGFIRNGKYERLFFYWNDYEGDYSKLQLGSHVSFKLGKNKKGICAINVLSRNMS